MPKVCYRNKTPGIKYCPKCTVDKPVSEFYFANKSKGKYRSYCKLCADERLAKWRAENLEWKRSYEREYSKTTGWAKRYPGKNREKAARRRSALLKRIPQWADLNSIRIFYINCPSGYEVDHIIPLQGENISGLHVLENLQYLPVKENRAKGNKF